MAGENYIPRTDTGNLIPPEYIDEIFKSTAEQSQVLAKARRLRDMDHAEMKMTVEDNLPVTYFVNGDTGFRQLTKSAWKGVSLYGAGLSMKSSLRLAGYTAAEIETIEEESAEEKQEQKDLAKLYLEQARDETAREDAE